MVNSFVWTPEEAKYLKAVLRWQDTSNLGLEDERRIRRAAEEADRKRRQPPAGEFRVLVIGARGTGKTSILTRFGNDTFRGEGEPPDPFYERGCRHPIDIDSVPYVVDALEMPSKHLLSNPMLEQALGITEAAILVYDVRDPASLRLVEGIAEFMRDSVGMTREYGLMLVGNKSDVDDEEREVSWAQGSKSAATIRLPGNAGAGAGCAFLEVSAKSGDNVDKIFPQMGREILRLKRLGQQRREQAERQARERQVAVAAGAGAVKKKYGIWRILSTPFFRRQPQVA